MDYLYMYIIEWHKDRKHVDNLTNIYLRTSPILPAMAGAFEDVLEDFNTSYNQAHPGATIEDIGEYLVPPGMAGNDEMWKSAVSQRSRSP